MKIFSSLLVLVGFYSSINAVADLQAGSCSDAQKSTITTSHKTTINHKSYSYDATVGFMEVTAADGKSKACVFYTSYQVKSDRAGTRPVTFAFNGGPGSASLWLHMGFVGPKRVDMGPEGLTVHTPFQLIDNDFSLLDLTDLVLIDPVATGFSAPEAGSTTDAFFGVKNDYTSVAAFIQNYLNLNNRWDSPKYVMGESYGGIRGSLLAHHLQSDLGIFLNGVIFVSPWLSTATTNFGEEGNDLPYVTFFPSFATTAQYHKMIGTQYASLKPEEVLSQAETFARGRYWSALQLGNDLPDAEFHAVAAQITQFTGIPQSQVEDLNLRISDMDYFVDLLDPKSQVVGRYDSRFIGGKLPDQPSSSVSDPSDNATASPFTAAVNFYIRGELGFPTITPYVSMANTPSWPMNADGQEFGVVDDLSQALIDNPSLKIYIASGLYDLACPYETVKYSIEHLAPRLHLEDRVTQKAYPAGHMMYINPVALQTLKSELVNFIK